MTENTKTTAEQQREAYSRRYSILPGDRVTMQCTAASKEYAEYKLESENIRTKQPDDRMINPGDSVVLTCTEQRILSNDLGLYLDYRFRVEETGEVILIGGYSALHLPKLNAKHRDDDLAEEYSFTKEDIHLSRENIPYEFAELDCRIDNEGRRYFSPIVQISLCDTEKLNRIADGIRKEKGLLPMYEDNAPDKRNDDSGWYTFEILVDNSDIGVYHEIGFTVLSEDAADHMESYFIPINDNDRRTIRAIIDAELTEQYGESVERLIAKAYKICAEDESESILERIFRPQTELPEAEEKLNRVSYLFQAYVANDLAAAEPDYVRGVLEQIGCTEEDLKTVGLEWLIPEE